MKAEISMIAGYVLQWGKPLQEILQNCTITACMKNPAVGKSCDGGCVT